MYGKLNAELQFELTLRTAGPLLICDGEEDWQTKMRKALHGGEEGKHGNLPAAADMIFCHRGPRLRVNSEKEAKRLGSNVKARQVETKPSIYIPGASLKGVMRSQAEWILRHLAGAEHICDPHAQKGRCFFPGKEEDDGDKENPEAKKVYLESCPACRLFGNTLMASRLVVEDADPIDFDPQKHLHRRDGLAIDRFTGGVSGSAKFDYEVVEGPAFKTRIRLRDFEPWMIGLLGFLLRDLQEGWISVGHGRAKGLGQLRIENAVIRLCKPGRGTQAATPEEWWRNPAASPEADAPWQTLNQQAFLMQSRAFAPFQADPEAGLLRHAWIWKGDWKGLEAFIEPFLGVFSGAEGDFISFYLTQRKALDDAEDAREGEDR